MKKTLMVMVMLLLSFAAQATGYSVFDLKRELDPTSGVAPEARVRALVWVNGAMDGLVVAKGLPCLTYDQVFKDQDLYAKKIVAHIMSQRGSMDKLAGIPAIVEVQKALNVGCNARI